MINGISFHFQLLPTISYIWWHLGADNTSWNYPKPSVNNLIMKYYMHAIIPHFRPILSSCLVCKSVVSLWIVWMLNIIQRITASQPAHCLRSEYNIAQIGMRMVGISLGGKAFGRIDGAWGLPTPFPLFPIANAQGMGIGCCRVTWWNGRYVEDKV